MISLKIRFITENLTRAEQRSAGERLRDELLEEHAPWLSGSEISKTDAGKPYVKGANVTYSVSHTDGCIMCAISVPGSVSKVLPPLPETVSEEGEYLVSETSFTDVGCDCEAFEEIEGDRISRITNRFFSNDERIRISKSSDISREFYCIWTAKEAIIKCTGEGIGGASSRDSENAGDDFSIFRFTLEYDGKSYCGAVCGNK